ncbi:hypothetical protein PGJ_00006690 [Porphyromonas gingivalis AJW4]|uniref:hypothetical protein n=1 Tax=Porphyromonas gingivalis TaxID=837 RepID=UPI0006AA58E4|nr:hypothetical protein [Porphyromonas gingivalis]ALA93287.1 hypothetical protein PGJ_00006690 [Porphyromonas gingivalis AJW4]
MNIKDWLWTPIFTASFVGIYYIALAMWDNFFKKVYEGSRKWAEVLSFILVFIPAVAYTLVDSFCLPEDRDGYQKLVAYVASCLLSLLSLSAMILLKRLRTLHEEQKKLENATKGIEDALQSVSNHPILKASSALNVIFSSLLRIKNKHAGLLEFVELSFKDISEKGFVRIDISFRNYSTFLGDLMSKSHNVIGSYSVRPKYLRDALESATCLQEYITKVNENQNKITRICMFSMEDINDILIDQYLDEEKATEVKKKRFLSPTASLMEVPSGGSSCSGNGEKEEIQWFQENISGRCIWTLTGLFFKRVREEYTEMVQSKNSLRKIWDFAIFDDEVLVIWRDNYILRGEINSEDPSGTLVVVIGEQVQQFCHAIQDIASDPHSSCIKPTFDELIKGMQTLREQVLIQDTQEDTAEVKLFKELAKMKIE